MITIANIPKKFHWLGNKNNFIAYCRNYSCTGQFAKYQFLINPALPVGSIIKVDVDGRSLFFKQQASASSDFYTFRTAEDFCNKLSNCFYLSDFTFTVQNSNPIVLTVEAKERGKHEFAISYMGSNVSKIANRFEIKNTSLVAVANVSYITCEYSYNGVDMAVLPNYALAAWWETESAKTPMFFLSPDESGAVSVDPAVVRSLISSPHLPALNANLVPQRILAATKYRLAFAELYGETPTINTVLRLDWRYGFDGKVSENRNSRDLPDWEDAFADLTVNNSNNIVRVIGRDNGKQIHVNQSKPEYIYILVANESLTDNDTVKVSIKSVSTMTDRSNTKVVEQHELRNNSVYVVNINADNDNVAYRNITVSTSAVCFETTIIVKPDFENQYLFLMKNSYGLMSCFASDGISVKKSAEIEKFSYDGTNVFSASNPAELFSASFVLRKAEAERLNGFSFCDTYMAVNGRWVKIHISTDSLEVLNSEDDIVELSLSFSLSENIDRREFVNVVAIDRTDIVALDSIIKI